MGTFAEFIAWHRSPEDLPDDDRTVLIIVAGDDESWPGYFDGDCWRNAEGFLVYDVLFWTDMPEGPAQ